VKIRDVDLAVRENGAGALFIWGHGLLGSMDQEDVGGLIDWTPLAGCARLVRYDARGHGRSEATLDPDDYRWRELARDLCALADALGPEAPVLGGVSMGCATSLHAAASRPRQTRALVLVAPPTAWETRPRQARVYRASAALVDRLGLAPFRCIGSLASLAVRNPVLARMQRSIMRGLSRADPRSVAAALRGAAASDLPDPAALRALRVPALVLAWPGDPSHPLSTAKRLAELLPKAELHVGRTRDDLRLWPERIRAFLEDVVTMPASPARSPRS
jgi:pimeloyl-ACP methyl ester carboxylesterase